MSIVVECRVSSNYYKLLSNLKNALRGHDVIESEASAGPDAERIAKILIIQFLDYMQERIIM